MDFLHVLEHHLLDHAIAPGFMVGGLALPITKHVVLLWIAAGLLCVSLPVLAMRWPTVPTGGRNLLETFVVFVRDDIVLPNTGDEGRKYLPYFLTLFFFILVVNLLGLIPGSGSATGNIAVTAALSLCTFFLIHVAGIREHGFFHHFKNFIPHGLPVWLIPLMFPLELVGLVTRCFALTIRLFANMIAGHIVLLAFLSLSFLLGSALVNIGSIPIAVGLSLLETFVCFLQAYIFTFLTAIFVGASLHPH
jgi:F-type H+-transporting ATPase subunit a